MEKKYCIGLDYGTLSGRAVLVEVDTGIIIAVAVKDYMHGVMDKCLPDGKTKLGSNWALQHPSDYIDVLMDIVPEIINKSGIQPEDVIGMSIAFTSCTLLPIDHSGVPLCLTDEFKETPHSYVKLWKHHAAQPEANRINELAAGKWDYLLKRYGGKISSEWVLPKIMQIINEAPEIYNAAYKFIEAADWLSFKLTGNLIGSSCTSGYKAMWSKRDGYPPSDFFKRMDKRLEKVVDEKMIGNIYSVGEKAGELTERMANELGLCAGTAVGVSSIDAHVAVPALGIDCPGKMLMIMGTSTCHMIIDREEKFVPGISGVVEDGLMPGFYGYEAGQACCGDHFEWFIENCVPLSYVEECKKNSSNLHEYMTEKARKLKPGESGLVALDWWNGNRSVLVDADLSGMILGCTLATKPEEIYRALVEATAFGTKMIIEEFENNGIAVKELYACGGIAEKNSFIMQIYSDITGKEIKISASPHAVALGAAMFGAVAAGKRNGGYDTIFEAEKHMSRLKNEYYQPIPQNIEIYEKIYAEYKTLHDYFGKGMNNVMKRLKEIKNGIS